VDPDSYFMLKHREGGPSANSWAGLTFSPDTFDHRRFVTVLEPACGAGAMIGFTSAGLQARRSSSTSRRLTWTDGGQHGVIQLSLLGILHWNGRKRTDSTWSQFPVLPLD
jgi:hypothetical protein